MSLSLRGFASETDSDALANSTHHRDFAATRDQTLGCTSQFSYKSAVLEVSPTSKTRGMLVPYMPYIFGRVDWIGFTPDRLPIVKVVCPVAATCSIRRAYYKQVAVLTQILDDDLGDLGEGHIMSWFSPDGMQISENDEGTIYMIIDDGGEMKDQVLINELCAFWVTMHRTDRKDFDGSNHRSYLLKSGFFTWVPTVEGDQKKDGYNCDLLSGRCAYC